jgi:DNA invertase Pin-like site-specific DNA recombinase
VIYVRESTRHQELSPVIQEARARQYCQFKGLDVVAVLHDPATSGAMPFLSRAAAPELEGMIRDRRIGSVVAAKLDRMFRDVVDCLTNVDRWERAGLALHLLDMGGSAVDTKSSAGRFMLTVLAAAAEMERCRIGERTRDALRLKRRRGLAYGATPYGYGRACGHVGHGVGVERSADCDRLVLNPAQIVVLARVRARRDGGASYLTIARELNAEGTAAARGAKWHPSAVRSILSGAIHAA